MDFVTSFDRPFSFNMLTLNADKTHGNRRLSKLDFLKNDAEKIECPILPTISDENTYIIKK